MHENARNAKIGAMNETTARVKTMKVRDFIEHDRKTLAFHEWATENRYYYSTGMLISVADDLCKGGWQIAWQNARSTCEKRQVIIDCAAVEGDTLEEDDIAAVMEYCIAFNSPNFNLHAEQRWLEEQAEETFLKRYIKEHGEEVEVLPFNASSKWLFEVEAC